MFTFRNFLLLDKYKRTQMKNALNLISKSDESRCILVLLIYDSASGRKSKYGAYTIIYMYIGPTCEKRGQE